MTVFASAEKRVTRLAGTLLSFSLLAASDILMAVVSLSYRDFLGTVRSASDWLIRVGPSAVNFVVGLFLGLAVLKRSRRVIWFSRWFLRLDGLIAAVSLIPWIVSY
jgi:hypothetical protein